MMITIVGAVGGEVTGSPDYVQTKGASVLVDCGLFQGGKRVESLNRPPTEPKQRLDAVLITHGHLDHTGRVPLLAKTAGPEHIQFLLHLQDMSLKTNMQALREAGAAIVEALKARKIAIEVAG